MIWSSLASLVFIEKPFIEGLPCAGTVRGITFPASNLESNNYRVTTWVFVVLLVVDFWGGGVGWVFCSFKIKILEAWCSEGRG